MTQSELAQLVGTSRNTISSIETGQFNPTAKLALIICIALDKKFEDKLIDWCTFYRRNIHRFAEHYLGIRLHFYQKIMLYLIL